MRKLLRFTDEEIVSEGVYIRENAEQPIEEIDISFLSDEEYKRLKKNPKDKIIQEIIDKRIKK